MWNLLNGVKVVPILLMANCFLGLYFNVATWYKVSDKTEYGAGIAIFGAIFTILLNLICIPIYGFLASAWITLGCYFLMCALGIYFGRKHYPIPYDFLRIGTILLIPTILYLLYNFCLQGQFDLIIKIGLIISLLGAYYLLERKNLKNA